jgi:hypothetical protein
MPKLMAEHPELLAQGIVEHLKDGLAKPVLAVGPPQALAELLDRFGDGAPTLIFASTAKPKRLGPLRGAAVIRAGSLELPAAARSLGALVAVSQLDSLRGDGTLARAVEHWRLALAPRGRLVVAEALSFRPRMPALRRSRLSPEDLCGALLNAGFEGIRQTWTHPRRGYVITTGSLRELTARPSI